MEVSDLIAQLAKLQLEQDTILARLADIASETQDETEIRVGDHVTLLTGGVRCIKGDIARVTKVTNSSVHFTILRNGHSTYKQHKNVRRSQLEE
jgi:transcription antitermination factor NusG